MLIYEEKTIVNLVFIKAGFYPWIHKYTHNIHKYTHNIHTYTHNIHKYTHNIHTYT